LSSDQSVYHIVLDAQGKFFCTGMDLSAGGSTVSDAEGKAAYYEKVEALYAAIDNAPQTTIAV
jgi:hydroxymethylglutaryl-CoA lyase